MSRSVVFNESVMFNDNMSSDHVPDNCEKELHHISVQVEHVADEKGVQLDHIDGEEGAPVDPPVDDHETEFIGNDAHDDVQHLPPVLQLEEDLPIAHRKSKRSCG